MSDPKHRIVIVGGGAAGLSLAVSLGRRYRRDANTDVILVDHRPTHIWKPLLHEVATGSLDSNHAEVGFAALGRRQGFSFVLGALTAVDPESRSLQINTGFEEIGLRSRMRTLDYDQLVIATGSTGNDFGTPGVAEHAILLDTREQAEAFHQQFVAHLHRINLLDDLSRQLHVVIVGGGATGVELAADLRHVTAELEDYGFDSFPPERLSITVLEAGPRLLAQLPERISNSVQQELAAVSVDVVTGGKVTGVNANGLTTADGIEYQAELCVWAAGIRAPDIFAGSGFELDNIGRVVVETTLNLQQHPEIFVIGDSSHCPMSSGDDAHGRPQVVPPRAQSAFQMSQLTARNLPAQRVGNPLREFTYRDYGSLVSLSEYSTVGNLMGNLMRGTLFIEGWLARLVYRTLYRRHQASVFGWFSTLLIMLEDRLRSATRSHLKLH